MRPAAAFLICLILSGLPAAAQPITDIITTPQAARLFAEGYDCERGRNVAQDYAKAMEFYRQAAAAGHPLAQFRIGYLYEQGWGVAKDYEKAMENYRLVAANNPEAQFRIGYLYELGRGVPKDGAQARLWYQKAAQTGMTNAATRLSHLPGPAPR